MHEGSEETLIFGAFFGDFAGGGEEAWVLD